MGVDILKNPQFYFKEVLEDALKNQNIETTPEVSYYLVNLLTHFMETENLYQQKTENGLEYEPLAIKYHKALTSDTFKKITLLKETGDLSLYISGFFGDSLNRSIVDISYYIGMGEAAYGNLSYAIDKDVFQHIFKELSQKFIKFVDILAEMSQSTAILNNESLLVIYEKWLKTKSVHLFKKLQEEGLIPVDFSDNHQ
ncbi:MAG: hypothetical protein HYW47_04075 [Deltaproteobacteria bacterium]|nr:hypothetical protein [Deltaproteobacteria bacterium]